MCFVEDFEFDNSNLDLSYYQSFIARRERNLFVLVLSSYIGIGYCIYHICVSGVDFDLNWARVYD